MQNTVDLSQNADLIQHIEENIEEYINMPPEGYYSRMLNWLNREHAKAQGIKRLHYATKYSKANAFKKGKLIWDSRKQGTYEYAKHGEISEYRQRVEVSDNEITDISNNKEDL